MDNKTGYDLIGRLGGHPAEKGWLGTYFTLLLRMPVSFMMLPVQTAGHKLAALTQGHIVVTFKLMQTFNKLDQKSSENDMHDFKPLRCHGIT